jgi:hypothetical protein
VADVLLRDGDKIHFGSRFLNVVATPGHTEVSRRVVRCEQSCAYGLYC